MKVYQLNVWEGRNHSDYLFTSKKEALIEANEMKDQEWVTEVWLRVWKSYGNGIMLTEENEPVWQR